MTWILIRMTLPLKNCRKITQENVVKAGKNNILSKSKIKPNNGYAKSHEGPKHNESIDQLIEVLRKDKDVTNIRKNQRQVDVNGNTVGANRPDVQFDKNGQHTNVEFDTNTSSMNKHKRIIPKNGPNSRNKFYKVRK